MYNTLFHSKDKCLQNQFDLSNEAPSEYETEGEYYKCQFERQRGLDILEEFQNEMNQEIIELAVQIIETHFGVDSSDQIQVSDQQKQ